MSRIQNDFGWKIVAVALAASAGLAQAQRFQEVVGTPLREFAYDVEETRDGGYATVGWIDGVPGAAGRDIHVVRYDPTGAVLWDRAIDIFGDDIGYSIVASRFGGFIVAAETSAPPLDRQLVLTRLNDLGAVMWTMRYAGTAMGDPIHVPHPGPSLEETEIGDLIVTHTLRQDPTLSRMTAGGGLVYQFAYMPFAPNGIAELAFTDLKEDRSSPDIFVSATLRVSDPAAGILLEHAPSLLRFSAGGAPIFAFSYPNVTPKCADGGRPIESGDGLDQRDTLEIVLAGRTDFGAPGQVGIHQITLTPGSVPLVSTTIDPDVFGICGPDTPRLESAYAAVRIDRRTQNSIIAGRWQPTFGRAALVMLDPGSALKDIQLYNQGDQFEAVVPHYSSCGFIATGGILETPIGFGGTDIFNTKTNDALDSGCLQDRPLVKQEFKDRPIHQYALEWFPVGAEQVWTPEVYQPGVKNSYFCFDRCCQACPADWNGDCVLNSSDFLAFLNDWSNGVPSADIAAPFGTFDSSDFLAYLNLYALGC